MLTPFRAVRDPRERVWGGTRFPRPAGRPVGELWVAGPWSVAADGRFAGRTLDEAAREAGAALIGAAAPERPGPRFPLLVKLLDPAAWLSVQVHPDDATARRLVGPAAVGKAEAWFVLEAAPDAGLLVGARPEVGEAELRAAIRAGAAVTTLLARHRVARGDALLLPPGTLHAVGPGVLLYELQQPSDITFRVDDWGRPRSAERPLHPADALAAVDPASRPAIVHAAPGRVVTGEHFALDLVAARAALDPAGRTLHVVTAVDGPAEMTGDGWVERLAALETLIVPASAGPYDLRPAAGARALVAGLP